MDFVRSERLHFQITIYAENNIAFVLTTIRQFRLQNPQ